MWKRTRPPHTRSTNTLVAVNAKDLRDDTPNSRFAILVRVEDEDEDEENVAKVRRLGVDQVISPSTLGGRLLAEQAVELGEGRRDRRTRPERSRSGSPAVASVRPAANGAQSGAASRRGAVAYSADRCQPLMEPIITPQRNRRPSLR